MNGEKQSGQVIDENQSGQSQIQATKSTIFRKMQWLTCIMIVAFMHMSVLNLFLSVFFVFCIETMVVIHASDPAWPPTLSCSRLS
jgi:hypothetical protein